MKMNLKKPMYMINPEKEFYDDLEREWRKSSKRYANQDILGIFPEAKEIIPEKIVKRREQYSKIEKKAKELLKKARELAGDDTWFTESVIKAFYIPDLIKHSNNIMRLRSYLQPKSEFVEDFDRKIERAREYPILELSSGVMDLRIKGRAYSALCPFHNEKTPSFFIYPESNTYHCFGCGVHGDAISLAQHIYNIPFKEAVLKLQ